MGTEKLELKSREGTHALLLNTLVHKTAQASVGGVVDHVLDCGNGRAEVFHERTTMRRS